MREKLRRQTPFLNFRRQQVNVYILSIYLLFSILLKIRRTNMLVEQNKIGNVVKRLFSGDVGEILGEILQNAQRAGARRIEFLTDTDSGTIIITDDGSGLTADAGKPEQFRPLITLAMSGYENPQVAEQSPMGVGIFSVLAHKDVSEAEISSNYLSLTLTPRKVWNDSEFWSNWQREVSGSDFGEGFRLIIKANSDFAAHLGNHLQGIVTPGKAEPYNFDSPARGYEDLLEITVNGKQVNAANPSKAEKFDVLIAETVFEGAPVKIGFVNESYPSVANWFGQIIKGGMELSSHFRSYLHVRRGTVLTPKSPTRRGIVADEKLEKFQNFVREKVREFVLDEANRALLTTGFIQKLADFDGEWFRNVCPYYTASAIRYDSAPESFEDFEGYYNSQVIRYEERRLLVETGIRLVEPQVEASDESDKSEAQYYELDYGLSTFIPQIGECFVLTAGNPQRLEIKKLWWKRGEAFPDETGLNFFGKGQIALLDVGSEALPTDDQWQTVACDNNVFAFAYSENWDITSADELYIGVSERLKDKIVFLATESWAVWSYEHDDASAEELKEEFGKSLDEAKATLFGETVEDDVFNLSKLKRQCGIDYREKIAAIEFLPKGVRVKTASGQIAEAVWLSEKLAAI